MALATQGIRTTSRSKRSDNLECWMQDRMRDHKMWDSRMRDWLMWVGSATGLTAAGSLMSAPSDAEPHGESYQRLTLIAHTKVNIGLSPAVILPSSLLYVHYIITGLAAGFLVVNDCFFLCVLRRW